MADTVEMGRRRFTILNKVEMSLKTVGSQLKKD